MPSSSPPETIELPAGVLSRLRETDAEGVAAAVLESLEHLRPWMPWATFEATRADVQLERCHDAATSWQSGSDYQYVLKPDRDGPVIGAFGLHRRVGPDALEIGYWVHADHAGHGTRPQPRVRLPRPRSACRKSPGSRSTPMRPT